jgi:zinc/manganese transport system substrate-binding protein/manganese/iron transport system substrate-binding protein
MLNKTKGFCCLALLLVGLLLMAARCNAAAQPQADTLNRPGEAAGEPGPDDPTALSPVSLAAGEKLKVVATTGIVADIVRNVGGDKVEVTYLLPPGADPHTFKPTPQHLTEVAGAHVIFANGMGLETFLNEMLENAGGEAEVVQVSAGIEPRALEAGPGHDEEAGHTNEDPHTWTSPANAIVFVNNIKQALGALDPANAATYTANAARYEAELAGLDQWVKEQIETIPPENRELVMDHLTFGYYADRYGLSMMGAVIPSFSTEAEPSARTLAELEDAIKDYDIKAVFVGVSTNTALPEQVARDTGIRLVSLYDGSLGPAGSGAETYLDYIRYNTRAIVDALK